MGFWLPGCIGLVVCTDLGLILWVVLVYIWVFTFSLNVVVVVVMMYTLSV